MSSPEIGRPTEVVAEQTHRLLETVQLAADGIHIRLTGQAMRGQWSEAYVLFSFDDAPEQHIALPSPQRGLPIEIVLDRPGVDAYSLRLVVVGQESSGSRVIVHPLGVAGDEVMMGAAFSFVTS